MVTGLHHKSTTQCKCLFSLKHEQIHFEYRFALPRATEWKGSKLEARQLKTCLRDPSEVLSNVSSGVHHLSKAELPSLFSLELEWIPNDPCFSVVVAWSKTAQKPLPLILMSFAMSVVQSPKAQNKLYSWKVPRVPQESSSFSPFWSMPYTDC